MIRTMPGVLPPAAFLGQAGDGDIFLEFAEAIGNFVFVADIGEAFEFAGAGGGNHHLLARSRAFPNFGHECGDVAVVARGGLCLQGAAGRPLCDAEMLDPKPRGKLQGERHSSSSKM